MPVFLGLALLLAGGVCVVAGVDGRGAQLFAAITGHSALGAQAGGSQAGAPAGYTPAGGGTGAGVTWT